MEKVLREERTRAYWVYILRWTDWGVFKAWQAGGVNLDSVWQASIHPIGRETQ